MGMDMLFILHKRWCLLLDGLSDEDLKRTFIHPDNNQTVSIEENIGIYAWHSKHHYAHIANLLVNKDWI